MDSVALGNLCPARTGVERSYSGDDGRSFRAKIFLENDIILVDDERHHTARPVYGRIGDEPKATDHLSMRKVSVCSAVCGLALCRENAIIVAMIGLRIARVRLRGDLGTRKCRPKRARRLAGLVWPI
jgi:hypothetical protein